MCSFHFSLLSIWIPKNLVCGTFLTSILLIMISMLTTGLLEFVNNIKFVLVSLRDNLFARYQSTTVADPRGGSGPPLRFPGKISCTWKNSLYLLKNSVKICMIRSIS